MTSAPLCGSRLLHGYQEEGECLQPKQIYNVGWRQGERERKREREKVILREERTSFLCAAPWAEPRSD